MKNIVTWTNFLHLQLITVDIIYSNILLSAIQPQLHVMFFKQMNVILYADFIKIKYKPAFLWDTILGLWINCF